MIRYVYCIAKVSIQPIYCDTIQSPICINISHISFIIKYSVYLFSIHNDSNMIKNGHWTSKSVQTGFWLTYCILVGFYQFMTVFDANVSVKTGFLRHKPNPAIYKTFFRLLPKHVLLNNSSIFLDCFCGQ